MLGTDPFQDLVQAVAGDGQAVVLEPDDGAGRVRRLPDQLGHLQRQLLRPAGDTRPRSRCARHPAVDVQDPAHRPVLAVDLRCSMASTETRRGRTCGGTLSRTTPCARVIARSPAGSRCRPRAGCSCRPRWRSSRTDRRRAARSVPVREAADPEQALDVPQLVRGEKLVDRPGRRQQVQLPHPHAGPMDRLSVVGRPATAPAAGPARSCSRSPAETRPAGSGARPRLRRTRSRRRRGRNDGSPAPW